MAIYRVFWGGISQLAHYTVVSRARQGGYWLETWCGNLVLLLGTAQTQKTRFGHSFFNKYERIMPSGTTCEGMLRARARARATARGINNINSMNLNLAYPEVDTWVPCMCCTHACKVAVLYQYRLTVSLYIYRFFIIKLKNSGPRMQFLGYGDASVASRPAAPYRAKSLKYDYILKRYSKLFLSCF